MLDRNDIMGLAPSGIKKAGVPDIQSELLNALGKSFFSIMQVDLLSEKMLVLLSIDRPEAVSKEYDWAEYADWYCQNFIIEQDLQRTRDFFSTGYLLRQFQEGLRTTSCESRYLSSSGTIDWIEVSARLYDAGQGVPAAYFFIRKTSKDHVLKSIIDLYVYNNCDYFIYLDAKRNSYEMFSGSTNGTPLPATYCDDYASEVVLYADEYVVPEDRAMVIREMQVGRVLEQLDDRGVHRIFCGVVDPVRGYTRKRLEYRYYDRDSQMVLLSRSDVTAMYEEERKRNRELEAALEQARTDPLTGLLNYQGTFDRVKALLEQEQDRAALFFIDLDNFKQVNDLMGHAAGDALLCRVADTLHRNIRPTDLIGRVGGDEFVAFLPGISSRVVAATCAQRLCGAVAAMKGDDADDAFVSCSIGIAFFPENGKDYLELRASADEMAYRAKREGKNRFCMR